MIIQDTRDIPEMDKIGITIAPDMIHIMKKVITENIYLGHIDKKQCLLATGFEADITQLLQDSRVDEDGYLVDAKGLKYDLTDVDVQVSIDLNAIDIIDNEEDGEVAEKSSYHL